MIGLYGRGWLFFRNPRYCFAAFNVSYIKKMIDSATTRAEEHNCTLITAAHTRATAALAADRQRLVDLQKINDHIRPGEIKLAQEQLQHSTTAITAARLRLNSLRLIVEGPSTDN